MSTSTVLSSRCSDNHQNFAFHWAANKLTQSENLQGIDFIEISNKCSSGSWPPREIRIKRVGAPFSRGLTVSGVWDLGFWLICYVLCHAKLQWKIVFEVWTRDWTNVRYWISWVDYIVASPLAWSKPIFIGLCHQDSCESQPSISQRKSGSDPSNWFQLVRFITFVPHFLSSLIDRFGHVVQGRCHPYPPPHPSWEITVICTK